MRRSLQLSLFAVVLLGLVGGSLAFFLAQKSVTLTVDGQPRTVGTFASTGPLRGVRGVAVERQMAATPVLDEVRVGHHVVQPAATEQRRAGGWFGGKKVLKMIGTIRV